VAIAGHPQRLVHLIGGDGGAWAAVRAKVAMLRVGGAALEFYWMQVLVLSLSSTFCDLQAQAFHVGIQCFCTPLYEDKVNRYENDHKQPSASASKKGLSVGG
jgi:hypothetical protein